MYFAGVGLPNDATHVPLVDAAARHNCDTLTCSFNQAGRRRQRFTCTIAAASRGQNTLCSGAHDLLKRLWQIGGIVECAMEGYRKRVRQRDKLSRALNVHAGVGCEQAEHDSVHAKFSRPLYLLLHDFEFGTAVAERTGTGPNHDVDRERNAVADL